MTEVTYTHSFSTEGESEVIDFVYYSEDDRLLFVELVSGVLAGYSGVPLHVFTAMDVINTNRLNGNYNESVGRYWNKWVKPNFTGYDTSDVNLSPVRESEDVAQASSFFEPVYDNSFVATVSTATLSRYSVTVSEGNNDDLTLVVYATDATDALSRFKQATEILGWDNNAVKLVAVTHYL